MKFPVVIRPQCSLFICCNVAFPSQFQFVWQSEVDTVNTIMLAFLSPPVVVVYETGTQLYYLMPLSPHGLTDTPIDAFLDRVLNGQEQVGRYSSGLPRPQCQVMAKACHRLNVKYKSNYNCQQISSMTKVCKIT